MKLAILVLLVPPTIALQIPGISSAQTFLASLQQPLLNLISNPFRRSTIPQFILDTKHPWILTNQRRLEGLPDAAAFLCSFPAPEPSETKVEDLGIPNDLFNNLEINNNRYGISRPGWPNALQRLGEMKVCPRALREVKTLEIDIYAYQRSANEQWLQFFEPSRPSEQLLAMFGDVLESMTGLETMKWVVPKEFSGRFEESFKARNLTLPSIEHLESGVSCHYLVGLCPNLEGLQNGGGYGWYHDMENWGLQLIKAGESAEKLKRFATIAKSHEGWTPSLVSEVAKAMPHLESLGLYGSIGRQNYYTGGDTGDSGKLKDILHSLSALENLTHLDLPSSSDLGIGFNGGPGCGNVYDGKEGQQYLREVTQEAAEATEKGGDIVVANLPQLSSFTIGGRCPNVTRTEEGMITATWPWTGRLKEWVLEVVPERDWEEEEVEYGGM